MSGVAATGCPTPDEVLAYLARELEADRRERVESHVDACAMCRRWMANVASLSPTASVTALGEKDGQDSIAHPGNVVGRYVVLSVLGTGGMGVVYAAYDPELDRKVAVKVLRTATRESAPGGSGRLLREAQALAKLSHPNVVAVHDVGTVDQQVWLAMEFVRGETLRAWAEHEPRAWQEVLDVMLLVGRGLASAHAAGLLHRDLKPENVMVTPGAAPRTVGRVRVMDFGLARAGQPSEPTSGEGSANQPQSGGGAFAANLTEAGALVGTPAYMAPEQLRGGDVDGRSDQFSFCVTLWETLYGQRPFHGDTFHDLVDNVSAGKPRPPPAGRAVPGWLRRTCERGLSTDPSDRFESMDALLSVLQRGHARLRRSRAIAVLGAAALLGGGALGWNAYRNAQQVAACDAAGAVIDEAWNDGARARVREALLATGVAYAETTADNAAPWIDARAAQWREHRTTACRRAAITHEWDADMLDRAVWCLEEQRFKLAALVAELESADSRVLDMAVAAAAGLEPASVCSDEAVLANQPPPPAKEDRADVVAVREELMRAEAMSRAGRYAEGLEVARTAQQRAAETGWRPVEATAHLVEGRLLSSTGAVAQSEAALRAAYRAAAEARAWGLAASAASGLIYNVGYTQARDTEGRTWAEQADVMVSLSGDPMGLGAANLAMNLGNLLNAAGESAEAKAQFQRALEIRERVLGSEHPSVALILANLGQTHVGSGEYGEAKQLLHRALAIQERALGPDHPDTAYTLNNLGAAHKHLGEHDEARAAFEAALARVESAGSRGRLLGTTLSNLAILHRIRGEFDEASVLLQRAIDVLEEALGPDNPALASPLANLAAQHETLGRYDEAQPLRERALAIRERALGPDHPDIAQSLAALASLHFQRHENEAAKPLFARALAISEKALGGDHPSVAQTLTNLASTYAATEAHDEARPLFERALEIQTRVLGPDHPSVATTLIGLGRVHLNQDRPVEAIALLERALAIYAARDEPSRNEFAARYQLAEALVDSGQDLRRALAEAHKARDGFRSLGKGAQYELALVERWLAEHER